MELESSPFSIPDLTVHLDKTLTFSRGKTKGIKTHHQKKQRAAKTSNWLETKRELGRYCFNLAGNAVKFTEKGQVELEFNIQDTSPATIPKCEFTDTGIGIAEDKIEGIFSAFEQAELSTTRKFGGTGPWAIYCENSWSS